MDCRLLHAALGRRSQLSQRSLAADGFRTRAGDSYLDESPSGTGVGEVGRKLRNNAMGSLRQYSSWFYSGINELLLVGGYRSFHEARLIDHNPYF